MKEIVIIATGNELLNGTVKDTNTSVIGQQFFPTDFSLTQVLTVGDNIDSIEEAIRYSLSRSNIILITGGIGPTDDDNTIEALQRIYGFDISTDEESQANMEQFFQTLNVNITDGDLKMVQVPDTSTVFPNTVGLAPGFLLEMEEKIIIAMPGVPREMIAMLTGSVIPYLKKKFGKGEQDYLSFKIVGIKEAEVNSRIKDLDILKKGIDWGMTAKEGIVTVTLVERSGRKIGREEIRSQFGRLFGERILDNTFEMPEEELVYLLSQLGITLACAESCTGGLISKRITDVPGASKVFKGGVVAYSNEAKIKELDVSREILESHGAVSEAVAAEMAMGMQKELESTLAISVTGIAGPSGGSDDKPIGTVWFGLASDDGVETTVRQLTGDRERIRIFSSLIAIEFARIYCLNLLKKLERK